VKEHYSEQQLQEMPKHNRRGAILYFYTTFFPPAKTSIALGKIPAVFAFFTLVTSWKGIIFWIKTHQICLETVKIEKGNYKRH